MTEVLHANIFFIITSIAVILFTLLVCILLYHLIKIVRAVRRIVDRVEAGSEVFVDEMENIRNSLNPAKLIQFVMGMMPGAAPKKRSRKRSDDEE